MAQLLLNNLGQFVLSVRKSHPLYYLGEKYLARWSKQKRHWVLPADISLHELRELMELDGVRVDPEVREVIEKMMRREQWLAKYHVQADCLVDSSLPLDPYQRVGVGFLVDAGRAILADEMGLGKTIQALGACEYRGAESVLVVAPKSVLRQWQKEIEKFLDERSSILTTTSAFEPAPFVITNYEVVVRRVDELVKHGFDALIVDEAARLKNPRTQRTQAVLEVAKSVDDCWLLTATPMPNRPAEVWSLLKILEPKRYTSFWRFVDRYLTSWDNGYSRQTGGVRADRYDAWLSELTPRMLRRTKKLIQLPPLSFETRYVELTDADNRLYDEIERTMVGILEDGSAIMSPNVISQITRLRQVACSSSLLDGEPRTDSKMAAIRDLLEDLDEDEKVLVFTTFAQYAHALAQGLQDFEPAVITGQTSMETRAEVVEHFETHPKCRVLIGTIGAIGEGLNLTAANVVVFANKPYVPSEVDQAVARAHRRGQDRPVHVISLVADQTIDEDIEKVLAQKEHLTSEAMAVERVVHQLLDRKGVRV